MKKICLLLCAITAALSSIGQTNPGMETWRTYTAGLSSASLTAPNSWYGVDSLLFAVGSLFISDSTWHQNLFHETTIKNSGTASAKVMTRKEDTLGIFPGILSNCQASFNLSAITGGGSLTDALSFSGGTDVTQRIVSVSAYVEYLSGFDSGTHAVGIDTGLINVQAISNIGGYDSVVGIGSTKILPSASFTGITTTVTYTDTLNPVTSVRIFFSSGGGGTTPLDSSTLYVDDVSMIGVPQHQVGVQNATAAGNIVRVYPNPANGTVYMDAAQQNLVCNIVAVNGQVVATNTLNGHTGINVSGLPAGTYQYIVSDMLGRTVRRDKLAVVH